MKFAQESETEGVNAGFPAHWRVLFLLLAVYVVLFVVYYPPLSGIEDEVGFIDQAVVWSRGSISAEGAGFDHLADTVLARGRHVSWRHPGRALTLLPLVALGQFSALFLSGALIHLLTVLVLGMCLQRCGLSPLWAVLALFHPTLLLFSRAVMSDELAGLLLLSATYFALAKSPRGLLIGLFLGAAVVTRFQLAVITPFFLIVMWTNGSRSAAIRAFAVLAVIGLALIAWNLWLFGDPIGYRMDGWFSPAFIGTNLLFYVPTLLLLYPLQLLAPFVDHSRARWFVRAICLPLFLLLLCYYYFDQGSNRFETLILGQRLISPMLPLWLLSFAAMLDRIASKFRASIAPAFQRAVLAVLFVCMLGGTFILFRSHQQHLLALKAARDEVARTVQPGAIVVGNSVLKKLFAVPRPDLPYYEWRDYDYQGTPLDHSPELSAIQNEWYLALLPKQPGGELPATVSEYVARYHMNRVPTNTPNLILFRAEPEPGRTN